MDAGHRIYELDDRDRRTLAGENDQPKLRARLEQDVARLDGYLAARAELARLESFIEAEAHAL